MATIMVGLCLAIVVLPACNKSNNSNNAGNNTADSTITSVLRSSTSATYFYYAMTRTHLDSLFNTTGTLASSFFTVFVPTDIAFEASGITKSILTSMTDSALKRLVSYQTIQQYLISSHVPNSSSPYETLDGETVYLTNNSKGFFINGILISQGDIAAKNGAIQFIWNSAALPPKGNVYQILKSDTTFTYFVQAMNRSDSFTLYVPFSEFLSEPNGATILAPNNHAFQINGFPDIGAINTVNPDSLRRLIFNQMVPGVLFTSDIDNGLQVNGYNSGTISFITSGAYLQVTGNANDAPAKILKANVMATNGVIYTIDQVIKQ
jgi:uncharacterized surface protein with fasciclin (FAS1) repeats